MIPVSKLDYIYTGRVTKVTDGDTLSVRFLKTVGLDTYAGKLVTLRLHGIDAPHPAGATAEAGLASKAFLLNLLMDKDITFTTNKDKLDPWRRVISVVYLKGLDGPVNDLMVQSGHAVYHRYKEQ